MVGDSKKLQPISIKRVRKGGHNKHGGAWKMSAVVPIHRLRGSVLGLVGFGRIPQLVAPKAKAFGIRVVAFDPYLPSEVFMRAGVERVEFAQLLNISDYVSIHSPLLPETTNLFNAEAFRFYFLRECPFPGDGNFDADRFIAVYNSDLANNLGNLYSRVVGLIGKNYGSKLEGTAGVEPAPVGEGDLRDVPVGFRHPVPRDPQVEECLAAWIVQARRPSARTSSYFVVVYSMT